MASKKSSRSKALKRLQKGQRPLPFGGPSPVTAAPVRATLGPYTLTTEEAEGWACRTILRPIDQLLAIMVTLYAIIVEGVKTTPLAFDHYTELLKIQDWLKVQPMLFLAATAEGERVLEWAMDFRHSMKHKWIGRLKHEQQNHLSAVAMNDPKTEKTTKQLMVDLGITQLVALPVVPSTPK